MPQTIQYLDVLNPGENYMYWLICSVYFDVFFSWVKGVIQAQLGLRSFPMNIGSELERFRFFGGGGGSQKLTFPFVSWIHWCVSILDSRINTGSYRYSILRGLMAVAWDRVPWWPLSYIRYQSDRPKFHDETTVEYQLICPSGAVGIKMNLKWRKDNYSHISPYVSRVKSGLNTDISNLCLRCVCVCVCADVADSLFASIHALHPRREIGMLDSDHIRKEAPLFRF